MSEESVDFFAACRQAVWRADQAMKAADEQAGRMAALLKGRLRKALASDLCALKRELRDYNIHTGKWKEDEK